MSPIQLKHLSTEFIQALHLFELPQGQLKFTALPKDINEIKDGQFPIVIVHKDEPVGFFILHSEERVREYSSNEKAMLLTTLSINYLHQGKGFAKKAMLLLPDFVKTEFLGFNEIVLVVNHKNEAAQKLYHAVGFQDTGERRIGPIGEQYVMKLRI